MFGLRKIHFTRQEINFLKVKFKISALSVSSVVKFLVFSVDSMGINEKASRPLPGPRL
jgi:hypothetical protein